MITIYVVSSERAAGKTTVAAALAQRLLGERKKVGFLRPGATDGNGVSDAAFMKKVLRLSEPVESLCPAGIDNVKAAVANTGKDVVIMEGQFEPTSPQLASALNAHIIGVESYPGQGAAEKYRDFGDNLAGVILNKVPKSRSARVAEIRAQFAAAGVELLGALPEDRLLVAPTIGELAEYIQGKILSGAEKAPELVESLLVGALSVDSGLLYFGRKTNKAAIIRADRPDMQLAALETSTRCLVVGGGGELYYRVVDKAAARGVPIVQTQSDINTIIAKIEAALVKARFAQEKKLPRLAEILQQSIDLKILYKGLGLAG